MTERATIFALSSGHGRAGVAVIRISGGSAASVLARMVSLPPAPRHAALRRIRHPETGEVLDQGLVLWLPGPGSETGEDMAELQVHGGPAVIRAVLQALASIEGCRPAEPGEFARRAFENGRLDLTAAEGLADLIDAETEAQRRQALAQAGGGLRRLYEGWREAIVEARALVEAAIDFSDEADVAADAMLMAQQRLAEPEAQIRTHLADGHRGLIVRDGFRVVLAGPPNVGKSSLMNALARREVAIVSEEAGTTRDVLEVRLDLGGYAVVLADTAGVRETTGRVEGEGVRRALAHAREADLVLWIVDATTARGCDAGGSSASDVQPLLSPPAGIAPPGGWLAVLNKIDAVPAGDVARIAAGLQGLGDGVAVSAVTGAGLAGLTQRIGGEIERRLGTGASGDGTLVPSQLRHRQGLEACLKAIEAFGARDREAIELRAEDLRLAADALGRIVGRIDVEEVLGEIFGRFCIGK